MNLFENLPADLTEEVFETLVTAPGIKIERIISKGHRSPDDYWYDQEQAEWVLIAQGCASLRVQREGPSGPEEKLIELNAGDWLLIPAHQRHRVEQTTAEPETIWLAVFFTADEICASRDT